MKKEVFISYHGGKGDPSRSSYNKAEELYNFLMARDIPCFLYKKESHGDFYDAIDKALHECSHFILVACDREMVSASDWVRAEVKQFDGLCKNGKKPNALLSAYIFGNIAEEDLYEVNSVFSTKDIAKGEEGFLSLYNALIPKLNISTPTAKPIYIPPVEKKRNSFEQISAKYLDRELKNFPSLSEEDFFNHCALLTKRIKCSDKNLLPKSVDDIIPYIFGKMKKATGRNLFKVMGATGTQKSYVLQLLYVYLSRNMDEHSYYPVYLHCDKIKFQLSKNNITADKYLDVLFSDVDIPVDRAPLFIIDGLLNVVVDDFRLDFALRNKLDSFGDDYCLSIGVTSVFGDNATRMNKSHLTKGRYEESNILHLSRVSIYDRESCLSYLATFSQLPEEDIPSLYDTIYKGGILFLDERIVDIFHEVSYDSSHLNQTITDIFETELLNYLDGDKEELNLGAEEMFEFAYGVRNIDFANRTNKTLLTLICQESTFLDCLIAIHYLNKLASYVDGGDYSFFQMVLPKEITRFISARMKNNPQYERMILLLGKHYNEMTPLGKSEMSFFLGRIANVNYRDTAISLLEKIYEETKREIEQKIADEKGKKTPYSDTAYRQDLFLLRGISVSLIYCGKREVLYEYIHSLIDNDLCNSINRGFHLEYYGDKRYIPNQDALDYEDNYYLGERTLELLCNAVENRLTTYNPHIVMLLELFTVVSLVQARIETPIRKIQFPLLPYVKKAIDLTDRVLDRNVILDPLIVSFFKMAKEDFTAYLERGGTLAYDPKLDLCNNYLTAKDVKRTGWLNQNIIEPESITEHMYATWFIGLVFLPNEDPSIEGYDKDNILKMLLIHDLAETKLGDIPKYDKPYLPDYDSSENDVMLSIFLKGTYSGIGVMNEYVDSWREWYAQSTENAKIAKDIDTIQAVYQFLEYVTKYPDHFDEARIANWLAEIATVKTKWGKQIVKDLVVNNPKYKDFLDGHNDMI